jgi:uncharacterized protein
MKEFIEYLLKQFVSKPDDVVITESEDNGLKMYLIKVADEDMGLVIGKGGKTIKSIRSLVRSKAIKDGIRVRIELVDNRSKEEQNSENHEDDQNDENTEL